MENSAYISLSLATAMSRTMEVAANNIANANTSGFKSERSVFESYVQQNMGGGDSESVSFVLDRGSYLDDRQGSLSLTENPLDVALQGKGWFSYETTTGQTAFGRDGRLAINAQGNLVTLNGSKILDDRGAPIDIPEDVVGNITISDDGTISSSSGEAIARLGVFELADIQAYERIGSGLFVVPNGLNAPTLKPSLDTTVAQGFIEQSNVQPIVEITRMMDIQKAYERAMTLMEGGNDLLEQTLRRLGRQL